MPLTWQRDTAVKPARYFAELVGGERFDILPWQGKNHWALCFTGMYGFYEPNVEIGTVAECKKAAEGFLVQLGGEVGSAKGS